MRSVPTPGVTPTERKPHSRTHAQKRPHFANRAKVGLAAGVGAVGAVRLPVGVTRLVKVLVLMARPHPIYNPPTLTHLITRPPSNSVSFRNFLPKNGLAFSNFSCNCAPVLFISICKLFYLHNFIIVHKYLHSVTGSSHAFFIVTLSSPMVIMVPHNQCVFNPEFLFFCLSVVLH